MEHELEQLKLSFLALEQGAKELENELLGQIGHLKSMLARSEVREKQLEVAASVHV